MEVTRDYSCRELVPPRIRRTATPYLYDLSVDGVEVPSINNHEIEKLLHWFGYLGPRAGWNGRDFVVRD